MLFLYKNELVSRHSSSQFLYHFPAHFFIIFARFTSAKVLSCCWCCVVCSPFSSSPFFHASSRIFHGIALLLACYVCLLLEWPFPRVHIIQLAWVSFSSCSTYIPYTLPSNNAAYTVFYAVDALFCALSLFLNLNFLM